MVYLIAATIGSAWFALMMRYAQHRKCQMLSVGAINYLFAGLTFLVLWLVAGSPKVDILSYFLGMAVGAAYILSYLFMNAAMRRSGLSITSAVSRLSVIIPVAVSVLFFEAMPGGCRVAGLGLVTVSLPLLGTRPMDRMGTHWQGALLFLAGLFMLNGGSRTLIKVYTELAGSRQEMLFLLGLFGTAALANTGILVSVRERPHVRDLAPGILLGLSNVVANVAQLLATAKSPFPLSLRAACC